MKSSFEFCNGNSNKNKSQKNNNIRCSVCKISGWSIKLNVKIEPIIPDQKICDRLKTPNTNETKKIHHIFVQFDYIIIFIPYFFFTASLIMISSDAHKMETKMFHVQLMQIIKKRRQFNNWKKMAIKNVVFSHIFFFLSRKSLIGK